jgi:flagellar biosynthesis protein
MSRPKRAAALRYDGRDAPRVVATGKGLVAEKILEAAREAGVPLREDAMLMEALATLELEQQIPPELYRAVAEALAWAYRLQRAATALCGAAAGERPIGCSR